MQYEIYRDKVKKVAAFLGKMYAHMTLIILSLVAIALVVAAMVVTKGLMLTQSTCPETVTYGEKLDFSATFLWSRTKYEYLREGETDWTTEKPVTPGTYSVRASGKTSFGERNYTDTHTFTVLPREITVSVSDTRITYGETPRVSADLAKGDTLHCEILYARYAPTTEVWVNPDGLRITDKNGNDRTACYIISDTPRSTIRITPRPMTVTVQDASKVYDDVLLTFDGYEITKGTLFGEDSLVAVFHDSIREVGSTSNTPTLRVYNAAGEDMTELYELTVRSGTLTVEQRPLIIKTGSVTYIYSGHNMDRRVYEVDPSTSLVAGHYLEIKSAPKLLDCGSVPNALTFTVLNSTGNRDVSHNYAIFVEAGTLAIAPREVTVSTESAELVYDGTPQSHPYAIVENGVGDDYRAVNASTQTGVGQVENRMTLEFYRGNQNITDNYRIVGYSYGTLKVIPRTLVLRMEDDRKIYDGTPLTSSAFVFQRGTSLVDGHTMTLKGAGSVVFGEVSNPYLEGSARILDRDGQDVTANYDISRVTAGTLTVDPRPITVSTATATKIYDGTPLRNDSWEVTSGSVLGGHELRVTLPKHTVTEVGSVVNAVDYARTRVLNTNTQEDVTHFYNISYEEGTLTVTNRPITVGTASGKWMYDGQSHMGSTELYLREGSLVAGHTLTPPPESLPSDVTTVKNAGKTQNMVTARILDGSGNDVTHNYTVQYEYGILTVHKRPITVQVSSLTVTYDGKPHASAELTLTPDSPYRLVTGHALRIKNEHIRTFTNVGTYDNAPTVSVYDTADGSYVTDNYEITRINGVVTVETRPLTLQINGEKIYDGIPLTVWRTDITNGTSLAEGHTVTASPVEIPTDAGTVQSVLDSSSIRIRDAFGNNVINNYSITWQRGNLTVHRRPVSLQTATAEKVYDGTPLTDDRVTVTPDSMPLLEGDTVILRVYGSGTQVGHYPNSAYEHSFRVYRNGMDVTQNYELERIDEGILTVKYDTVLRISTGSASKDYDGFPLFCDDYTVDVIAGTLPEGCTVYVNVTGSILRPGTAENTATVTVWDEDGTDVTEFMTVNCRFGALTVRPISEDNSLFGRFMASTSGTLYLRMASYGDYNGKGFDAATPYNGTLSGGYTLNYLPAAVLQYLNLTEKHTVYFKDMQAFMLPYYMEIGGSAPVVGSDTRYDLTVGPTYTASYYSVEDPYTLLEAFGNVPAALKPLILGSYSSAEQKYRSFVYDHYLSIDRETLTFMKQIISAQGFNASDPTVIRDVAAYVRNAATYTLYYDPALDESSNVAVAFLRDYREGKCVHYATAATMLYRALGIPARYVTGFMVEGQEGEWVDITNPGHAWVEVYVDCLGWVQVEVTGSSGDPGPGINPPEDPEKPTLELIPAFRSKIYDGSPLYSDNALTVTPTLEALLELGYTYTVRTAGSITDVGDGESYITEFCLIDPNGIDVTQSYNLVKKNGLLRITPAAVEVFLYPMVKTVDGRPAVWSEGDYSVLTLPDGVTLTLTVSLPAYDLGYVTLAELNLRMGEYVTYKLTRGGQDVTAQYPLTFTLPEGATDSPVLEVRRRAIEVTAASETRIYDGTPLKNDTAYLSKGSLISGHRLVVTTVGTCNTVGTIINRVASVIILDRNDNDVTRLYNVTKQNGALTLLAPPEE